ncbi:peptidoglycan DD-metalloendopeptidase family protein [Noviherbaspirillum sp.]|uniref:peptidoglycan DD-metalloendopeptidase family protein n=1 Tax=Noviherbaspirillum sp. TaxID=1926288 RepID=UPI002B4A86B5|nr:peptidoglycan DD-metalloendopeptidase family protein [Noviherbaspirillum sp.]HJV80311.1 peptidoglycan DD-metalloendopeptidase family protein [Noviherbaspirillum sp.]
MEGRYYTVKRGDSLWGIAKHFGYSVEQLAARNGLTGKRKKLIGIGQRIYLPDGKPEPDLWLDVKIIGLSSKPVRHAKIRLTHDGKTSEAKTDEQGCLHALSIQDHAKGLKIEFENIEGKWQSIFDAEILPLGEKLLQINIGTDLLKDRTARKAGPTIIPDKRIGADIKQQTPQPTAATKSSRPIPDLPAAPLKMDSRTDDGVPATIVAPLFASENLYLQKGNEKFRQAIIESAKHYHFTPHALAAIIHAEAAKGAGGGWKEASAAGGSSARGLGQFLPAAWFQYIAKPGTLGNAEALKLTGATKLEAEAGSLYQVAGSKKNEIGATMRTTILSWRDHGGYSIDAIGAYAQDNLFHLKKHGIDATNLPPDEQVKVAYIMHHEGPRDGLLYLQGKLGKTQSSKPDNVQEKLISQFRTKKDDGTAKAKALADRFGGDYVKAYYYFLANHTETMVQTKNFMLKRAGFKERSVYDIVHAVTGITIEKPVDKSPGLQSTTKTEPPASQNKIEKNEEVLPTLGVGGNPCWIDPLDQCAIRVGGYSDSESNPESARRKSSFGGRGGRHTGIDLCAVPGTPVKAVANGEIIYARPGANYGNVILLKVNVNDLPPPQKQYVESINPKVQDNTVYFMYAHLSELSVTISGKQPAIVNAGKIIGKSGDTGNAKGMIAVGPYRAEKYGAHLHFEARRSSSLRKGEGKCFDPKPFLNHCD